MCGRFVITSSIEVIADEFSISNPSINIKPSYNISPSQNILAIINQESRKLITCKWGFIPSWAKDSAIGHKMINARAETLSSKPAFKSAYKKQRCLIVADGFYEWKKTEKGKVPYYIHLKSGKPFGFAGIYNRWTPNKGECIDTCSIITTCANELIESVHDRMPVIVPKDSMDRWLDADVTDESILSSMLKSYPSEEMEMHEISTKVNAPKHNSPELLEPVLK